MVITLLLFAFFAFQEGCSESILSSMDCGQFISQPWVNDTLPKNEPLTFADHAGLSQAIQEFVDAHPNDRNAEASVLSLVHLVDKGCFPEIRAEQFITPALYAHFVINRAIVRTEHPDWSSWRVYLEATWRTLSGVTHTGIGQLFSVRDRFCKGSVFFKGNDPKPGAHLRMCKIQPEQQIWIAWQEAIASIAAPRRGH